MTPRFAEFFYGGDMLRIGVIGIVLKQNKETATKIQGLLSLYSNIIVGRMGVPDKENGISTIAVIVKGTNEEISALTGKLGKLESVSVKSALTSMEV
jgi:putative iron-only hydrogenase system regulator